MGRGTGQGRMGHAAFLGPRGRQSPATSTQDATLGQRPQGVRTAGIRNSVCPSQVLPLKGQNPQTVPTSQGWSWEGTAAWQRQGTASVMPPSPAPASPPFLPLPPKPLSLGSGSQQQAEEGLGSGGDMGKQEMVVENRSAKSHRQSSPQAGAAEAATSSHGPSPGGQPCAGAP